MNETKIRLSPAEMELVTNAEWILTKNGIMRKAWQLLEDLQDQQQAYLRAHPGLIPAGFLKPPPKISKGENYQGLPYLILDHPRFFEKENILAIRTLFWWGQFFSCTLHLSGSCKRAYEERILRSVDQLGDEGFYLGIHDSEWEHHFGEDNYIAIREMNREEIREKITAKSFLKLAQKIPLRDWEEAPERLAGHFRFLVRVLSGTI